MREAVSPGQFQNAGVAPKAGAVTPLAISPDAGLGDDVALANALAHTASSVTHVVDVSAGRYGVAATYGPGQRIVGIVLHRQAPSEDNKATPFVVEAHVVVAAAAVTVVARENVEQRSSRNPQRPQGRAQSASGALGAGAPGMPGRPILLRIADDVRRALAQELRELRPDEMWAIDVSIDDLREEDAPVR